MVPTGFQAVPSGSKWFRLVLSRNFEKGGCGSVVYECGNVKVWEDRCGNMEDECGTVSRCESVGMWECGSMEDECGSVNRCESVGMWECGRTGVGVWRMSVGM